MVEERGGYQLKCVNLLNCNALRGTGDLIAGDHLRETADGGHTNPWWGICKFCLSV